MKKCTACKEEKEFCFFNKNKTKSDGHNNICRECSNQRSKKYYNENKEHHKSVIYKRNTKIRNENRRKLYEFYLANPCVDCGEKNPIVLEFDHKNSVEKTANISSLLDNKWETIQKEIDKCDVRCANCHRIRTAKQFGWYKDFLK